VKLLNEELLEKYSDAKRQSFHTSVVGITFRDQDHIKKVNDGDFAVLIPELENQYDSTAVSVVHNDTGNCIGYIKRDLNKDIWNNIVKNGDLYVCKITKTGGTEDKPNVGFNLTVVRMYHERESVNTAV
jgi:hypothetical protein